tara:strand:+ start:142 stop:342 length:201 start_codon:yes stop_codon:yes gene_type:complete
MKRLLNWRDITEKWLLGSDVSASDCIQYCHSRANELHRTSGEKLAENLPKANYFINLAEEFMESGA